MSRIPSLGPRLTAYNLVLHLALLAAFPWALLSLLLVPRRRTGFAQRLGGAPPTPPGPGPVWIHAVSVGEARAVAPMLPLLAGALRGRRELVLSTVTVTGQATARGECPEPARVFYFPLDLPWAVARALGRVRPVLFVTAETEVWPNFLGACFARGIPTVVVNGRISDRSFARYHRFSWLFRPFFARISLWLVQSREDAARVTALGADPGAVRVTGNAKYDQSPRRVDTPAAVRQWAANGPLLSAVSTHRGEEEALLALLGHEALAGIPVRLALAPRHPERFDEVANLLAQRGVAFFRWSDPLGTRAAGGSGEAPGRKRVLLVDRMGVLDGLYPISSLVFVGGSLVPVGGHNLLEPAAHAVPVLTGPYTHNFRDIASSLSVAGGCRTVPDLAALAREAAALLSDPAGRDAMGRIAREEAERHRGASRRNADLILDLLGEGNG